MLRRSLVAGMALVAVGCGGKGEGGGGGGGGGPAPDDGAKAAAVKAAQDKVPKELAITFEAVNGEKDRHLAIQPKGWETGVIPGRLKPPAGSPLGFMTSFATGSNCDGDCTAKDWAKVADSVEFAGFAGSAFKIEKDEKLPDGRLVVAKQEDRVDIALARWKEGASRYYVCRVTLDREVLAAAAAFEEACRQMKVLDW